MLRLFHGRCARDGRVACGERCTQRGYAIHGRVLDAVFEVLEQQGLEVYLVNARHTKNLPGRKR